MAKISEEKDKIIIELNDDEKFVIEENNRVIIISKNKK